MGACSFSISFGFACFYTQSIIIPFEGNSRKTSPYLLKMVTRSATRPVEMKSSDLEEISIENEITNRLKQALVDKHLGGDNQGKNYRYLTSSIGNWEQLDAQLNLVKNLLEPYKGRRLSKEEVTEKAQLRI